MEKRDYFSLVFLILGVLEYKNFAKADLYRKKKIDDRWSMGQWSVVGGLVCRWSMVVDRSAGAKTIGGSVIGGRTVAGKTVAW